MYAHRQNCFLLGSVLAAVLCATLFLPSRALALDYLDGELTEKQAATEVGIYCAWTSSTGRKLNGYDSSQSMYSADNLSMIHEWNQDFKAFNEENGDAINTVWPVSEVTDIAYAPTHTQYDDLYRDVSMSYEQFRQRYPNASLSDWQLNFGAITNPTRCLMQGFALSNSTKEYGTIEESTANWYSKIVYGVEPAHVFYYNGTRYQIGQYENDFAATVQMVQGGSLGCQNNALAITLENAYPMFYVAYPMAEGVSEVDSRACWRTCVMAFDSKSSGGTATCTLTPYAIAADGTVTPSRNNYCFYRISGTNDSGVPTYNRPQITNSTFTRLMNDGAASNCILIPVSSAGGFAEGGGENDPTTNGGDTNNYINVPSPTITYNGGDVSYNSSDNSVTIGSVTYEQGQYEYDQSSDTYTVNNDQTYNYYTVTNDTPESPVTDTNDGLGWLGTLLNLLIDGIKAIADMVGKLGEILWGFISDFVIGDLDSIDFESLKLPDIRGVFPFSLPFDAVNVLQMLSADAAAPVFDWPLVMPDGTQQVLSVDLSGLDSVAGVVRTVEVIAFVVGLALGTRRILGG